MSPRGMITLGVSLFATKILITQLDNPLYDVYVISTNFQCGKEHTVQHHAVNGWYALCQLPLDNSLSAV